MADMLGTCTGFCLRTAAHGGWLKADHPSKMLLTSDNRSRIRPNTVFDVSICLQVGGGGLKNLTLMKACTQRSCLVEALQSYTQINSLQSGNLSTPTCWHAFKISWYQCCWVMQHDSVFVKKIVYHYSPITSLYLIRGCTKFCTPDLVSEHRMCLTSSF